MNSMIMNLTMMNKDEFKVIEEENEYGDDYEFKDDYEFNEEEEDRKYVDEIEEEIEDDDFLEENDFNGYVETTSYTIPPTKIKQGIAQMQQGIVNPDDYDANNMQIIGIASLAFIVISIICCIKRTSSRS